MIDFNAYRNYEIVFNEWRLRYNDMSFEDHKRFYVDVVSKFPCQRRYDEDFFINAFVLIDSELPYKELCVLEFGGHDGALAHNLITSFDQIVNWINYDLFDPIHDYVGLPYKHIYHAPMWHHAPAHFEQCDRVHVFVSAHAIEHISNEHFDYLYHNVISKCEYAILEIPISEGNSNDWTDYMGTHILGYTWNDILKIMHNWKQIYQLKYGCFLLKQDLKEVKT